MAQEKKLSLDNMKFDFKNDAKLHFIIAGIIIFIFLLILAKNTGINADDRYHVPYTKTFVAYYTSFGKDTTYRQIPMDEFWKARNMFDMVNYGAGKLIGADAGTPNKIGTKYNPDYVYADLSYHHLRHYLLAILSFIGIVFAGLTGAKMRNYHFGIGVMAFLCISPCFIGHAAMNPRDMPFFTYSTIAVYFMYLFLLEFPKVSWKNMIGIMIGVGLALNVRNGGFLTFAYFGFFSFGIWAYHLFFLKDKNVNTKDLFIKGCVAFFGAYIIGLFFWPYGQTDPVYVPIFEDLLQTSKFPITLKQLFDGKLIDSGSLPWYYQSKLLLITTPIVILIGFFAFFVLFLKNKKLVEPKLVLATLFCAFFPVLYIIEVDANVHTGWRHVIFSYPYMVIMALLGWEYIMQLFANTKAKNAIIGLIVVGSLFPAMYIASNMKHCYVYFNEIVGGNKGAFGNYEMDYWSVSLSESADWFKEEVLSKTDKPVVVTSNMWDSFGPYLKKELKDGKVKLSGSKIYKRSVDDWDYAFYYAAFLDGDLLKNEKFWPPKNSIHVVYAGGAPIGAIVQRDPEKNDYKGYLASQAGQIDSAIYYFKKAVAYDDGNDENFSNLAFAYLQKKDLANAIPAFENALAIHPTNSTYLYYLCQLYFSSGKKDQGYDALTKLVDTDPTNMDNLQKAIEISKQIGDQSSADYYIGLYNEQVQIYQEKQAKQQQESK